MVGLISNYLRGKATQSKYNDGRFPGDNNIGVGIDPGLPAGGTHRSDLLGAVPPMTYYSYCLVSESLCEAMYSEFPSGS